MGILAVRQFDNVADPLAAQRAHYRALQAKAMRPRWLSPGPEAVAPPPVKKAPVFIESTVAPSRPRFIFIEEVLPFERRPLPMKAILLAVSREFLLHPFDITSERRRKDLVRARFALMHFLRESTKKSLPEIGLFIGGRDHTTVIHGLRKAALLIDTDPDFAASIEAIRDRLSKVLA